MSKTNYARVAAGVVAERPHVIVVVAFGIILKEDLLALPPYGCVNVHASLLPRYRGVSPVQAAILAGERETGCTTMRMDSGIDTGDILLQASLPIRPGETAGGLSERLSTLGAELLIRTLDGLIDGTVTPVPQDASSSSYAGKIRKTDGEIDWSQDATSIERRIRAMTPWPSAYTFRDGHRLIVVEAVAAGATRSGVEAGTVISLEPFVVACGTGALEVRRLKPEGKKGMTPDAYVAGHRVEAGEVLG
jgi:methionyl-tRNA formyltransferase